jgi:hypothetical protein
MQSGCSAHHIVLFCDGNIISKMSGSNHWVEWHKGYSDPASYLSRRLLVIQQRLDEALNSMPSGPIQLVSMCAGQGRDVIGVLERSVRAGDTRALLIEIDGRLCQDARDFAVQAGIGNIEVREDDASSTSAYVDVVPADVLMACGVFGNISDDDVHLTISRLPSLLSSNATVIWTRHRRRPDMTTAIRRWFRDVGFEEIAFDTEHGSLFGVGTHRFAGDCQTFEPDQRLFTFLEQ